MQVLGGRVEALAAAHEAQQLYGGLERPQGAATDTDVALAFRQFVPGATLVRRQHAAARLPAVVAPTHCTGQRAQSRLCAAKAA